MVAVCERQQERSAGFTLVEVLLVTALMGVLMGMIFTTFSNQQDSYLRQQAETALVQNLRAALHLMGSEIRMAGLFSGIDRNSYAFFDWDPQCPGSDDSFTTGVSGIDNISGAAGFQEGSDLVMVVRAAADDRGVLGATEGAAAGSTTFLLNDTDLDGDGDEDLNARVNGKNYGVLVKSDLGQAQLFRIVAAGGASVTIKGTLKADFGPEDIIARVDILIFSVDDSNPLYPGPVLTLRNAGSGNSRQAVAENIADLQVTYRLADGTVASDPAGVERMISAVTVTLTGRVAAGGKIIRERKLSSTVKVRNR